MIHDRGGPPPNRDYKSRYVMTYGSREVPPFAQNLPVQEYGHWAQRIAKEERSNLKSNDPNSISKPASTGTSNKQIQSQSHPVKFDASAALNPTANANKWGWKDGQKVFLGGNL